MVIEEDNPQTMEKILTIILFDFGFWTGKRVMKNIKENKLEDIEEMKLKAIKCMR